MHYRLWIVVLSSAFFLIRLSKCLTGKDLDKNSDLLRAFFHNFCEKLFWVAWYHTTMYTHHKMKIFLTLLVFLVSLSFCMAAVSTAEIVKLTKLKTSDDVIIQLIQKNGLDKKITSKDIVYLKEQGVSDRVIRYLLKISQAKSEKLPKQETPSTWLSENLRSYYTTGKDGKRVRVVTNLDENGLRIGGEAPPEPPEPQKAPVYARQEEPREIYVTVRNEQPQPEEAPPYQTEEPYYNDGIPLNGYYPGGYFPYYPGFFPGGHRCCPGGNNNQPTTEARYIPLQIRPRNVSPQPVTPAPHFEPVRPRIR
jgi:hypothetical protein